MATTPAGAVPGPNPAQVLDHLRDAHASLTAALSLARQLDGKPTRSKQTEKVNLARWATDQAVTAFEELAAGWRCRQAMNDDGLDAARAAGFKVVNITCGPRQS